MGINIRAMMANYDAVQALWQKTEAVGSSVSDSRKNIEAFLERNPNMSAVTFSHNELVSAVLWGHDGRRGYLHQLVVAGTFRRQGIAKTLIGYAMSKLEQHNILKCNVSVSKTNALAKTFYTQLGWTVRDDLKLYQRYVYA